MYKCKKCGECCRNLNQSKLYEELHNGDGVCKFLDKKNNICMIYQERPTLCNVDKAYEEYFTSNISKEEYYSLNYEGCKNLWKMKKKRSE